MGKWLLFKDLYVDGRFAVHQEKPDICNSKDEALAAFLDAFSYMLGRKPRVKQVDRLLKKGCVYARSGSRIKYRFTLVSESQSTIGFDTFADEIGNFWGGDDDIAGDVESVYEDSTGKSAWLWSSYGDTGGKLHDDLETRPEDFATHGYTQGFEEWGLNMVETAIRAGKHDYESIFGFIQDSAHAKT